MSQQYEVRGRATRIRSTALVTFRWCGGITAQRRNCRIVEYHDTPVVVFTHDGDAALTVILNHGGWRTATTKTRMTQAANQFDLPYRVYQRDFQWYIAAGAYTIKFEDHPVMLRFNTDDRANYVLDSYHHISDLVA